MIYIYVCIININNIVRILIYLLRVSSADILPFESLDVKFPTFAHEIDFFVRNLTLLLQ